MRTLFLTLITLVAITVAATSAGSLVQIPETGGQPTTVTELLTETTLLQNAEQSRADAAGAVAAHGRFLPNQSRDAVHGVQYIAPLHNGVTFVTRDALTYTLAGHGAQEHTGWTIREQLVGASPFQVAPDKTTAAPMSFFIGSDPAAWQNNVPSYTALALGTVYDGIRLNLHATRNSVEKVFVVEPGASPNVIALRMDGATGLRVATTGELEIGTGIGTLTMSQPVAYQEANGERTPVPVAYTLEGTTYGFTVGAYDPARPLVIDPTFSSTYVGGQGQDYLYDVTTDSSGNVYVTGQSNLFATTDIPYPTTTGAYTTTLQGGYDVVVSKFDPALSTLLASTFIGGKYNKGLMYEGGPDESGYAITLDTAGNIYVAGDCFSIDFPTTPGAYDTTADGAPFSHTDGFVAKFDPTLSTLLASTRVGGDGYDGLNALAIGPTGEIYGAGTFASSIDTFQQPVPTTGYQLTPAGGNEGMVVRFSADLTTLTGLTLLGGQGSDILRDMILDSSGNVFVTGETRSTDFPTTPGAYDPVTDGNSNDAYVAKFNPDLTTLMASTILGGTGDDDHARGLALGPSDSVYVTGAAMASDFPTTTGAYDPTQNGGGGHWTGNPDLAGDVFVSRLSNDLTTLMASTFVGTNYAELARDIVYDSKTNSVFVVGQTDGNYLTTVGAYYETVQGNGDSFISRLDSNLTRLLASTYYGGTTGYDLIEAVTLEPSGNVVVTGHTNSADFPTTEGAFDTTYNTSTIEAFLARIPPSLGPGGLVISMPSTRTAPPGQHVTILVRYRNTMETAVENAVVVVDIPPGLSYLSSTGGGSYYPGGSCGGQVFWKLGTVTALTGDDLSLTLDIPWGMAEGIGNIHARIAASNLTSPLFDVQPYLDYTPLTETSRWLSSSEITTLLATSPVKEVYEQAQAWGYHFFGTATATTRSDGETLTQLFLVGENGALATLNTDSTVAFVEVFYHDTYTIFDQNGGYTWDRSQGTFLPWGAWASDIAFLATMRDGSGAIPALTGLREARCQFNCTLNSIPETAAGMLIDLYDSYSYFKDCKVCAQSYRAGTPDYDACAKCTATTAENTGKRIEKLAKKVPGLGTAIGWGITVKNCVKDCVNNPDKHICTGPKVECCGTIVGWLGGFDSVCTTECNRTVGIYEPVSRATYCAYGDSCVNGVCGPGCKSSSCKTTRLNVRVARDPNMKSSDVDGRVLPGQQLTYTIDYENVGSGTAEAVYILDMLDQDLDETTLQLGNGGTYSADSRTVSWDIGTLLGGQKGQVSFSVNVRQGLADGTEVVNVATVYFPSAFEETPTNPVVHVVNAVVATPQTLETTEGTPLAITLGGQDAAGGAISTAIALEPGYGTLTGTPPTVIYTPMDGFIGQDRFFFTASNTVGSSDTAEVTINVIAEPGSIVPPQVESTFPAANATGVRVGAVQATFTEPVDATSITTETFSLAGVTGYVTYDELARTATFHPDAALTPSTVFVATLGTGIRDKNGNALSAPYSWQFTTAGAANIAVALPGLATELHFSEATTETTRLVSVSSIGTDAVSIGTIVLSGTHAMNFSIIADTCSNISLVPQNSCSFEVVFNPQQSGELSAALSIPSSDSDTPTIDVPLFASSGGGNGEMLRVYLPLIKR